jgi:MFS transporter, CP family, cyanate transporter
MTGVKTAVGLSPVLPDADRKGSAAAVLVVLAGVSAALHVAKLFPALPVLREHLGISLVEAGFLLSAVQLAGMTLGLAVGLLADGIGLKRSMLAGLVLLSGAGVLGGWTQGAASLLVLRAIEGAGFLLVCTPAPALIRRLVAAHRLSGILGIWSSYMPLATALALLCGPFFISRAGWQAWWWALSALSLFMAVALWKLAPADDVPALAGPAGQAAPSWVHRLRHTLSSPGPWLVALSFAAYSGQWVAVIGFLPSIYTQAGFSGSATAGLTALAAAVNMLGNMATGWLQGRGLRPQALLYTGFCVMGLATFMAFMTFDGSGLPASVRYIAVLLFSMVGGVIPGTLFTLAVRLAPGKDTVSTTVGWMQQWSAFGQFVGPPLVAWVASSAGGWQWTWVVTGACASAGLVLAWLLGRQLEHLRHAKSA